MAHNADGRAVLTRLARAVHAAHGPTATGTAQPQHQEEHRQTNWLRDVILGGQDGLVNILGIILGVIAGGGLKTVLLATGFAAAFTESISMGAVGYTSALSERDYYAAERTREETEIDATPEAERQEIRDIYAGKGFSGELLERVVDTITGRAVRRRHLLRAHPGRRLAEKGPPDGRDRARRRCHRLPDRPPLPRRRLKRAPLPAASLGSHG